jgi:hypothetical protein
VRTLLVHPSLGNKDGAVNVRYSLDVEVDFVNGAVAATLTPRERVALLAQHPSGRARFWGTYTHNASQIARVHEGALVLFTGGNRCFAWGVVGVRFDNAEFARVLWQATEDKGTYAHVYSLARFERVDIPYDTLRTVLGPKYPFRGLTVYDADGKGDAMVETLGLDLSHDSGYDRHDRRLAVELADEIPADPRPIETVHTPVVRVISPARTWEYHRGEAMLVQAYAATLGDTRYYRLFTSVGITDLCVDRPDGMELVEAKSAAGPRYVREALAQLFDYARAMEPPVLLSGLFPSSPEPSDLAYLHAYGIDCVYREGPGQYRRLAAPITARFNVRRLWAR